jgi:hypothetical protein
MAFSSSTTTCMSRVSLARMPRRCSISFSSSASSSRIFCRSRTGQALELHLEDGLRLELREPEGCHQPFARFAGHLARTNQLDDFVEVIEGEPQAFQDVRARSAFFRSNSIRAGPPRGGTR